MYKMKSLFIILALCFYVMTYSQENYSEEVQKVSQQIESIRVKRDWIKNDPVEDSIAVSEGWYIQMEGRLEVLFEKKRSLMKTDTGKRWVSYEEFEKLPQEKREMMANDPRYIVEQASN